MVSRASCGSSGIGRMEGRSGIPGFSGNGKGVSWCVVRVGDGLLVGVVLAVLRVWAGVYRELQTTDFAERGIVGRQDGNCYILRRESISGDYFVSGNARMIYRDLLYRNYL